MTTSAQQVHTIRRVVSMTMARASGGGAQAAERQYALAAIREKQPIGSLGVLEYEMDDEWVHELRSRPFLRANGTMPRWIAALVADGARLLVVR